VRALGMIGLRVCGGAGLAPDLDGLLHSLADESEVRPVLEALLDGWLLVKRVPC
jgi:hypothetical protein